MYRVTAKVGGVEYLLHDPRFHDTQIFDDELSEEMGHTPTYNFSIEPGHPHYDKIKPLVTEVRLYRDERLLFFGRVLSVVSDINNLMVVSCVGALSYLADSMISPFEHTGTLLSFLETVIGKHNAMVESSKQFTLGNVEISGESGYRNVDEYVNALSLISDRIVSAYGGYLRAREDGGKLYLDYIEDYGGTNYQQIRFGENILDISQQVDATDVITCLIAEGAAQDDETTLTATVENDEAIAQYGRIWGFVQFDNATTSTQLAQMASAYLVLQSAFPKRAELTALDLSLIDVDVPMLELGYWTKFYSEPHQLEAEYLLRRRTLHVSAPQNDTVIFGAAEVTMTGTSLSDKEEAEAANDALYDEVQSDLADMEERAEEKYSEFTVTTDAITARVGSVEKEVDVVKEDVASLEITSTQIQTRVSHVEDDVETAYSEATQAADKISLVVSSGTNSSNLVLNPTFLSIVTDKVLISDEISGVTAQIDVSRYGVSLAPSAGTVYLGAAGASVYCRNILETNYFYAYTQIRSGGNCVVDGQLAAYSGVFESYVEAETVKQTSDERLKTNIEAIDEAVGCDLILGLAPVQYSYTSDTTGKRRFGFIAQQVRAALEATGYTEENGLISETQRMIGEEAMLGLSYTDLIAPLVVLVQNQEKRIKALEAIINEGN